MLEIRLTLNNLSDHEQNASSYLPLHLTGDEIIQKICDLSNVLSRISRDEIALLYERAQSISRCLMGFVVEDSHQIQPLGNGVSRDAHGSIYQPLCIDPCLLDRSELEQCALDLIPSAEMSCARQSDGDTLPSPTLSISDCGLNEFDEAFQELTKMNTPWHPSRCIVEGQIPQNDTQFLFAMSPGNAASEDFPINVDEDYEHHETNAAAQGETSQIPPSDQTDDFDGESLNEDEVIDCEARQVPITFSGSPESTQDSTSSLCTPSPSQGHFYPTPDSNSPDKPTSQNSFPEGLEAETSGAICASDRAANESREGLLLSKTHLSVDDAHNSAELNVSKECSFNDDLFGESDITSAIDEAMTFLQGNSSDNGGITERNAVQTETSHLSEPSVSKYQPTVEDASDSEDNYDDEHLHNNYHTHSEHNSGVDDSGSNQSSRNLDSNRIGMGLSPSPCHRVEQIEANNANASNPPDSGGRTRRSHKRKFLEVDSDELSRDTRSSPLRQNGEEIGIIGETSEDPVEGPSNRKDAPSPTKRISLRPDDKWKVPVSHHFEISNLPSKKREEVERKASCILHSDLPNFMDKHTESWKSTGFWRSVSSDISQIQSDSATNPGRFSIWRYVEALQGDGETHYLRSRLAHVKLYLAYVAEFDRLKKKGLPSQTAKRQAVDLICGTKTLTRVVADKARKSFQGHKLIGERWWWSGQYLGLGFILSCSKETGFKIQSNIFPLDAFILYVVSNHQGSIVCCGKFDHSVKEVLFDRNFPKRLHKSEVKQWINEAKHARQENALITKWKPWSTDAVLASALDFLRLPNGPAGSDDNSR